MNFHKYTLGAILGTGFLVAFCAPSGTVSTATALVSQSVERQIPFEFHLERAKTLIAKVEPQIIDCKRRVAETEVEVENLEKDIAGLEKQLRARRANLAAQDHLLTDTCKDDASPTSNSPRVVARIKYQLRAAKRVEQKLKGKQALLVQQTNRLAAEHTQLDTVRERKLELGFLLERLLTQKRYVDALAARHGSVEFDKTTLADAHQVLTKLGKQLDVRQRILENDAAIEVAPDDPPESSEDLASEVKEFLSRSAPEGS